MNENIVLIVELVKVELSITGVPLPYGTFKYRYSDQAEWTQVQVSISPLLFSRMFGKGRRKDMLYPSNRYTEQQYRAPVKRRRLDRRETKQDRILAYNECPFNLKTFQPVSEDSNIPLNCRLEAVDESYGEPIIDTLSNRLIGYNDGWKTLNKWVHHEVITHVAQGTEQLLSKIRPAKPISYPVTKSI